MFRSKTSQLIFVKFPVIFPILYGLSLFFFPYFEKEIILITILILAETHFGVTWPFFINKVNYPYLNEKKRINHYFYTRSDATFLHSFTSLEV